MKKAQVTEFFERLAAHIEAPTTELDYRNPYTLLVAVVLSAQATDKGVNKATKALFAEVETPAAMLTLGEARLKKHIKTIGLFNTKTKNVIALSRALVEEHGGAVPNDRAALEALPGVGRKTANVVLNTVFGEPRRFPESAARPRTWCSTRSSASLPSPSTLTSSGSRTAAASRPEKRRAKSRTASTASCPSASSSTRITG